jgi:hypothetical protein
MKSISNEEVEKRLRAWADVTMLSIELKKAMFRNKYPGLSDDEIRSMIRKEHSTEMDYSK